MGIALALLVPACIGVAIERSGHEAPRVIEQLDSSHEGNLPTWWSSLLLATAAAIAGLVGLARRRTGAPWSLQWLLVAGLLAALSADETAQFHEGTVGPIMDRLVDVTGLEKSVVRVIAAALVLVALAAMARLLWPWLRSLAVDTRKWLLVAGTVYFSGSVGLEVLSRLLERTGSGEAIEPWLAPFEEGFEMVGASLAIFALLPLIAAVSLRDDELATRREERP